MKITAIHIHPMSLALKKPYHWSGGVFSRVVTLLVEVKTDEGITGYGEVIAVSPWVASLSTLEGIKPMLIGQPAFDIERLMMQVNRNFQGGYNDAGRFASKTLAGLEAALWDILGKAAGRPVYQLMGGAYHNEIDYFGFVQGDTTAEIAAHARQLVEEGHTVIYLKVGRGRKADLENTAAVRAEIGDCKLRLDPNEAWDPRTAIDMIHQLAQFNPEFIEQPTPANSISALRQVKESVPVPIAADQLAYSLHDVYDICRQRAADLIVLSIHEAGGLLALKKAAAVAQAAGISICLHTWTSTAITDFAQCHVALTLPNLADGNQFCNHLVEDDVLLSPKFILKNGKLGIPDNQPGLGFEIDWDVVARCKERYEKEELN